MNMNEPLVHEPVTQLQIDQRVFDLYDEYCHGRMDRREFMMRASALVVGGLAMAQALMPRYAQAQTISFTDTRIKAQYVNYPSPGGNSKNDAGVNGMWPAYEAALKAAGVSYESYTYPGTQHGFHNNSTPRYSEAAAKLSWERTVAFFKKNLA